MKSVHERFLDHLASRGWVVSRVNAEAGACAGLPATTPEHAAFLSLFAQLSSADDTRWFLGAADYAGSVDSAFAWDAFQQLSLDAAMSDEDRRGVQAFWDRHLPIFMSVDGEYAFLALDRESGRVVHGIEPEFEAVSVVAPSLEDLFEDVMAGGPAAAFVV
ncbi:hypothetical protein ACILG0_18025 [Pseudomonadota bacterium AL_CKDN230030165-1A_HGKHYDSX7]